MINAKGQPAATSELQDFFATVPTAKLLFATVGSATDNTFYENGKPVRSLMAFVNEESLKQEQDEIWEQSKRRQNLIALSHPKAAAYGDRVLFANGCTLRVSHYLDLVGQDEEELELMGMLDERNHVNSFGKPLCVIRFRDFAYVTEAYNEAKLMSTESWIGNQRD